MNVVFSLKSEQFSTSATAMPKLDDPWATSMPMTLPAISASMAMGGKHRRGQ